MNNYPVKIILENKRMRSDEETLVVSDNNMHTLKSKKSKSPDSLFFQVYFEHLQTQLDETLLRLETLQTQLSEVQKQLSVVCPETSNSSTNQKPSS